ncbi:MAG: phenylacetate--CoA ligase [Deltaproteobacteria bacterium]|nr:phenylacetate--CoA ligase [Deltaproteobacteria bacterium]
MIYNEDFETLPREVLETLQVRRLQQVLQRAYHTVGFYKKTFDKAGIRPDDIKSLADIGRVPFTTKQDIVDNYPFGLFAVPMSNIVRLHASSGMKGRATVVGYTKRDIETWSELMTRCFVAAGLTKNDIILNAFSYGLFTGGLGVHYGAEKLGASVIPTSGGNTKRQLMILQDFGPTAICCTPSYALTLAAQGREMGVDLKALKLRVGIFGGEPWSDKIRQAIEDAFGIKALDLYGMTEVMGPGVSIECIEGRKGMHVFEDHFIVEMVHPETGAILPPGEQGELVFTTLTKEAFPLIRYRTRDLSRFIIEPCRCGRSHIRIDRIKGRSDDAISIRGVNVFPAQIESVLTGIKELEPKYRLIVDRAGTMDTLEIQVEVNEKIFSDSGEVRVLQNIERRIAKDMKDYLGISAKIKLVEPNSLPLAEGKTAQVLDKRQI